MATTTLRVPEELKARIQKRAEKAGKTAHAFMLEALEEKVESEELRAEFYAEAEERLEEMLETGEGLALDDVARWLRARAAGKKVAPPKVRTWRK